MNKYEYNALIESVDALRAADVAFNKSYLHEDVDEEQIALYHALVNKLDDVYTIANMVIENEQLRMDKRRRSRRVAG